jgi:hypothetical protein
VDAEPIIKTQIEPELVEALGLQAANSVLTRATLCYVLTDGDEQARYEAFVRAICADERVIDLWEETRAQEHERTWLTLIRSEPNIDASKP